MERSDNKTSTKASPLPESAPPSSHKRRGRDAARSPSRKKRKRVRRKQLATKRKERRKRKRAVSQVKVNNNNNDQDAHAVQSMGVANPAKNSEMFLTARRGGTSPSKIRGTRQVSALQRAARVAREVAKNTTTVVRMEYWATFSAAHRVNTAKINPVANEHLYGLCNNLHGHNYHLRVTLKGLIDNVTGMLYSHANLAILVQEYVLDFVDHACLENDLGVFFNADLPSTTENLAILIYHLVSEGLGDEAHLLHSVFVGETKSLGSVYEGEEAVVSGDDYSS